MKQLLIACLLTISLYACLKEDQKEGLAISQQKWQLVKMTGSMVNSETTGKDMAWQEYIALNADNSFVKSRDENGNIKVATGTYSFSTEGDERYIELTYNSGYELMASCYSGLAKENLRIISSTKVIGTWNICDGPGLEYHLVDPIGTE